MLLNKQVNIILHLYKLSSCLKTQALLQSTYSRAYLYKRGLKPLKNDQLFLFTLFGNTCQVPSILLYSCPKEYFANLSHALKNIITWTKVRE